MGVTEIVEPDHGTPALHEPPERLADRVRADRIADLVGEHAIAGRRGDTEAEVQLALLRTMRCSQRPVSASRSITRRLRRVLGASTLFAIDNRRRLVHGQGAVEVDVGPAQADGLAAAHAGQRQQRNSASLRLPSIEGRNVDELGRRPDLHLRSLARAAVSDGAFARRATFGHEALALGVVEHLVEHGVDVMDGRQRQALAARPPVRSRSAYIASRSVARISCNATPPRRGKTYVRIAAVAASVVRLRPWFARPSSHGSTNSLSVIRLGATNVPAWWAASKRSARPALPSSCGTSASTGAAVRPLAR